VLGRSGNDFLRPLCNSASYYTGDLKVQGANAALATITAPAVAAPAVLHIILTVKDVGSPNLFRYARVVLTISP